MTRKSFFDEMGNIYYVIAIIVTVAGSVFSYASLYIKVEQLQENQKDNVAAATQLTKVATQLDDLKEHLTRIDNNLDKIMIGRAR